MLYKTLSAAVYGIDANIIEVEVDVSGIRCNEDHFTTVGLPDAAVRESRERIRAALKNCGYDIPPTHITINLAPADIRKEGSGFDLPMAMGILGLTAVLAPQGAFRIACSGGRAFPRWQRARGARRAAGRHCRARQEDRNLMVPEANAREAAVVEGVNVYPVRSLIEVVQLLNAPNGVPVRANRTSAAAGGVAAVRRGLPRRARAAERQARPGSGLRRRPQHPDDRAARLGQDHAGQAHAHHPAALTFEEALETTKIHSVPACWTPAPGWSARARSARRTTPSPMPA